MRRAVSQAAQVAGETRTTIAPSGVAPSIGSHICFRAASREVVHAFYDAALAHGGRDDGAPGIRYAVRPMFDQPNEDPAERGIDAAAEAKDKSDEFRMHARAALDHGGFSPEDLKEIVLQQAIYCGVPAANSAFEVLREVCGS